ncbi:hypothetical protein Aperf_G00000116050 [Anoplocephala perfoliata]
MQKRHLIGERNLEIKRVGKKAPQERKKPNFNQSSLSKETCVHHLNQPLNLWRSTFALASAWFKNVDEFIGQSRGKRRMGVWKSQKFLRNVRDGRIQKRRSLLPSRWRKQQMFQKKDANTSAAARTQLIVSNLHYGVSDADIHDLFQELGTIYRAAVHYDRSGRSTGIAEVTYTNRASAVQAIECYNGVPLDGRPMNIQLLREDGNKSIATTAAARMRLGTAATRGRQPPRGPRGTHGGRSDSGRHNNRNIRAPVTKEQLDAELAAYFAQVLQYTDFFYIST